MNQIKLNYWKMLWIILDMNKRIWQDDRNILKAKYYENKSKELQKILKRIEKKDQDMDMNVDQKKKDSDF